MVLDSFMHFLTFSYNFLHCITSIVSIQEVIENLLCTLHFSRILSQRELINCIKFFFNVYFKIKFHFAAYLIFHKYVIQNDLENYILNSYLVILK